MKSSLRTRLILSFVVIIMVTMGSFALIGRVTIRQWFNNMVLASGKDYAQRMSFVFGQYYLENESWEGVENLLLRFRDFSGEKFFNDNPPPEPLAETEPEEDNTSDNSQSGESQPVRPGGEEPVYRVPVWISNPAIMPPRDERLLLLDTNGNVIFDNDPEAGDVQELLKHAAAGTKIVINGKHVGTVVAASSAGILNTFQEAYLKNVNLLILVGGALAILGAIGWGTWMSVRIVRPVKALSQASLKLAGGDYSQRIDILSNDELGEMTKAFNQMADDLEKQEMLRRRSLADVAHELRTPLSVLQIDLESIEDGIIEADAEAIQHLQLEVTTLRNLVEDLRILSLADAGELKLEFIPVEVNGIIQVNIKRIERSASEKGVNVVLDLAENELFVMGDEQRLSQVLLNLLSNALHFTPKGGVIEAGSKQAGQNVQIWVRDTGEGISPEDLQHIFERLYRSDRARARGNGGSGLGLSIARSLVETHGGKIWAESEPGKGSQFIIELPLFEGED